MKNRRVPLAFLLSILMTGCDGATTVRGYVFDQSYTPVSGVLVTLRYNNNKHESRTDSNGAYDVGMMHSPWTARLTLEATKVGYKPYKLTFSSNSRPIGDHKIILESTTSP
jgi:hypothetical protein